MENQNLKGLPEHDQYLMNLSEDLPEHESNIISSAPDSGILSEDLKNNYENDIEDHVLMPEKVTNTEKQHSLENTFEVIDNESKSVHDVEEVTEVASNIIFKDEENVLENDPVSCTKIDGLTSLSKPESPKEESIIPEKLESKIVDTFQSVISQENEPINVVQSEVKIADTHHSEVIPKVFTKKDADEGDTCDIKIGPEELFCRIGLGKIIKFKYR